eukprot:5701546-Pyramimonas_sp.AAC.1
MLGYAVPMACAYVAGVKCNAMKRAMGLFEVGHRHHQYPERPFPAPNECPRKRGLLPLLYPIAIGAASPAQPSACLCLHYRAHLRACPHAVSFLAVQILAAAA